MTLPNRVADIVPSNRNTSPAQVADLVGRGQRVLVVGRHVEDLADALREQDCVVTMIAADEPAFSMEVARATYEVVVLAEVLEHVTDPGTMLTDAVALLADGGRIVASVPNVTHGSVRLSLLQGRWRAGERTPVRPFSRQSLEDLFTSAGLLIESMRGVVVDPLDAGADIDEDRLPDRVVEWVRDQPDALVLSFQVAARPLAVGEASARPPELVLAADPLDVRLADRHHHEAVQAERDSLMLKDHVIGLQAAATAAKVHSERQGGRIRRQSRALKELRESNEQLTQELQRLRLRGLGGWARRAKRRLVR